MWLFFAGCGTDAEPPDATSGPTFYRDVQPVLAERCGGCHRDGGLAGDWFSVESYASVKGWEEAIADAAVSGRMPPWTAEVDGDCAPPLPWADDPRPTEDEKQLLRDWVEAGSPEGEPSAGGSARIPADAQLDANLEVTFDEPFEIGGDADIYQCFRLPLGLDANEWLTGLQIEPGNDRVVHHVLVWNDPYDLSAAEVGSDGSYPCDGDPGIFPTELLGSWTPGTPAFEAPAGAGATLFPGGSLVVNVHYHPTGTTTETDSTTVRVRTTTTQPSQYFTMYLLDLPFGAVSLDDGFLIPPDTAGHVETVGLDIPTYIPWDLEIFQVGPHMHYLGTDMRVWIERADDSEQCLLHDPGYRFDFQNVYGYDPSGSTWPVARPGDRLVAQCTYDNTASNPFLADHLVAARTPSSESVSWGEETGDEMCMARVGILLPPINWWDLIY